MQSAENDAAAQVSQAENVLTQGVDAIVIQPVDFNVAGRIADLAREAGVPLASYDDLILNSEHDAFIGRDPKEGGAEAARETLAVVPNGNYVLIGGDPGQTGSTLMQEGYHEVLDPLVEAGDVADRDGPVHPGLEDRAGPGARRERADGQRQRRPGVPVVLRRDDARHPPGDHPGRDPRR